MQQFTTPSTGEQLFLKLARSELGRKKRNVALIISLIVVFVLSIFISVMYAVCKKNKAKLADPNRKETFTWGMRFYIIEGVARGILYLHRDSRLRIIHWDMKAGNILLDNDMIPKISDFGLARTFLATQDSANTHLVVGTFGYMSPEYAMRGVFSEKSDVFSFGILLLEVISSKKNSSFFHDDIYLNLAGYAWQLWNGGRGLDLIDRASTEHPFPETKVLRCFRVGLLCVQDYAEDRPSMSEVVLMLSSDSLLPLPKQPSFSPQSLSESDQRVFLTWTAKCLTFLSLLADQVLDISQLACFL